ncbi:TonB-dependent receptor [Sphingobium chlorophenolicum]|uniref:TonB-dependent receptor n=1 Tax=Sphingobium chlorophenolicum TaxID=46429 RepID=A0A081R8K6_SPHCR|nr:TonB-dependent receptor [Sphingobium chlorophenolicum]KEQ51529.1 TonB-dependent receptor [Sphingobium chlorophenolicum]
MTLGSRGVLAAVLASAAFPAVAWAQAPEAEGAAVGGIVVTARLREEDPQHVPASLSLVSGEELTRTYTVNSNQLSQLVPALNYSSANPRNTAFTIRGLGSSVVAVSQANDGLEPGVGFYIDGIYHARPATAAFDFVDVERVEVLRGPQGTLFGKNSVAGAISIVTKKPSFDFGAEGELSYGSRDFVQAKAAVTGPIAGDVLAFRLSGSVTRQDGTIWNVARGERQNDIHNDAVRGQLLFQPSPDFSLRLVGDWANFENVCCAQVFARVAPTLKPVAQRYAALAAGAPGGAYAPPSFNPYDRVTDNDAPLGVDTDEGGVSATAEWKLGGTTLTSISAWRFWNWDAANDRDYTGLHIQTTQHIPSRQDQFSQEFRIGSNMPGPVEYVAGLYYFHQKITGRPISIYGPLATYWLLPASGTRTSALLDGYQTDGRTDFRSESFGIFGEVTWRPVPRLAVTGGLRYTYEEKDGVYDVRTFGGVAATAALQADQQSILRAQSYSAHDGDGSASGRVNVAYDLVDGVMTYVSFAKGQKSGGINMSGLPVNGAGQAVRTTAVVRPETNTTWEAGFKTRFFGDALTFNIDAYHIDVTDFQANIVDSSATVVLRSYLANIPKVTVKGIEFEAAARIGSRLVLRASGAYSDGKYASYPKGPCPIERTGTGTAQCDLSGQGMPGLPEWVGSAGGEYHVPLTVGAREGELFLRGDAVTRTRIFGDAAGSAYMVIKGYTLVNGSVGYRTPHWELAVFARNLFDKDYMQNMTVQAGNSGLIVGTPSEPRTVGVTLRTKWGG